jgi:hypothetical protein
MRKLTWVLTAGLLALALGAGTGAARTNTKLAQTGFQFLSVVSDGRASALSGAVTSLNMGSSSLFFNPAGLAGMSGLFEAAMSDNRFIAGIHHQTASLALRPLDGRYGVIGFSAQWVDYGEVQGTYVDLNPANPAGYLDSEILTPSAKALGAGYAKAITDRFSVGGQVKYVTQDLGWSRVPVSSALDSDTARTENKLSPLAFDFGTRFATGIKSLVFGMSVRNFSKEVKYSREAFQLPLVFAMGVSMDIMDVLPATGMKQSLLLSIDATHDRSYPEQLIVGLDWRLLELLSLRGGYISNSDISRFSFGMGVSRYGVSFDYAYTPLDYFDPTHRMTVRIGY